MFDFLKRRKDSDFEDIRSGVLGPQIEPDFPPRNNFQAPEFEDVTRPRPVGPAPFDSRPKFDEPPGFNTIDTRGPQQSERNYDIIDRLSLIESQLAAIRSQTETINERLKNMERLLPRRY
jgi:hypothetical protein